MMVAAANQLSVAWVLWFARLAMDGADIMSKKATVHTLSNEDIERLRQELAYQIWEEEGHPHGRDQEHWLAACERVEAMMANAEELPSWLQRAEAKPATATEISPATAMADEAPAETTASKFKEAARRFARAT